MDPLVQVVKGNFNFAVINRRVVVFHAVIVDQAVFIIGNENVNLAEIFRPNGETARIAYDDRGALRLFRHFLCCDFLIGARAEEDFRETYRAEIPGTVEYSFKREADKLAQEARIPK